MRNELHVRFESLESRRLLSAGSVADQIFAVPQLTLEPAATTSSSPIGGYSPQQIQHAYGFDQISLSGGIKGDGSGQTIAIVDAYNNPKIASDLHTFDQQFSLNDPNLTVVSQTGSKSSLPATDAGWAGEIALDVEWAHAMAPGAKILLVEAKSAALSDLMSAVDYARSAAGVSVVSVSWGTSEFSLETSFDSHFMTPSGHQGVSFVASAGDSGSWHGAAWPSVAPGVLSVGGTTLYTSNSSGTYAGETGWGGSGGGISRVEPEPSYQSSVQNTGARTAPDVSFDANPYTGFAVYTSIPYQGYSGWQIAGGTSAGAPQWAALIAIANQGRALSGQGTLDGATGTLPALYSTYKNSTTYTANVHDVQFGRSSFFIGAASGYDLVTGLGSPQANRVVQVLIQGGVKDSITKKATVASSNILRHRAQPMLVEAAEGETPATVSPPPATPASPFSQMHITSAAPQLLAARTIPSATSTPQLEAVTIGGERSGPALSEPGAGTGGVSNLGAALGTTPHHELAELVSTGATGAGIELEFPFHHEAMHGAEHAASTLAQLPIQAMNAATIGAFVDQTGSTDSWKQWTAVAGAAVVIGAWAMHRRKHQQATHEITRR